LEFARCWGGTSIGHDRHRRSPLGFSRVAMALPVASCNYAPTMDLLGSFVRGQEARSLSSVARELNVALTTVTISKSI
jgi:hypothetical protein